jgi:hypothetical protein
MLGTGALSPLSSQFSRHHASTHARHGTVLLGGWIICKRGSGATVARTDR